MPSAIRPSSAINQRALGSLVYRAAQKLDGAGKVDLTHGIEQNQAEGDADEKGRVAHGSGRDGKRERDRLPHQVGEQKVHQLVQQDARRQPQQQADEQHEHRFPENQAGEVAFFHAQNVVQAELLFAPAHEKAVGIEQKDHAENGGNHNAQLEGKGQGTRIIDGDVLQGTHDVHHGRGEDGGKNIRIVYAAIFADAAEGQPRKESFTHGGRLPLR